MNTKVKYIMDRFSKEEAMEMIKSDEYTEDGTWKAVYMEKNGGFYEFIMVLTNKGKFYNDLMKKNELNNFIKLVTFESEKLPYEELEQKAKTLSPTGYSFLYLDLLYYSEMKEDKEHNIYRAMYELI